jgi:hypothetical protein
MPSSYPPLRQAQGRLFGYAKDGHPHLWWLLQFESRAAPPTLRFPERTGVAFRSDLAHDNQQNSNFLFRLR